MAIQPQKRELLFVKARPSEEELNARFFKRVSYPVLRPAEQEAVAFNKNNELLDLIRGSKSQDKNLKADIEKRLRRALLDKEVAMDKLAEARYNNDDDAEEFYLRNIEVLDGLIRDTRREYDRVNLSAKYLDDLKPIEYESLTSGTKTPELKEDVDEEQKTYTREELFNLNKVQLQGIIQRKLDDIPQGTPNRKTLRQNGNRIKNRGKTNEMREWIWSNQDQEE